MTIAEFITHCLNAARMLLIDFVRFIYHQSPTATAFLNSSFIQPHRFNAIVYDLNRPQFTVNINVYGYNTSDKPVLYKSILTF